MRYFVMGVALLVTGTAFAADDSGNHYLVGKWTWTRSANHCTESYLFREDGTAYTVSGEEKSDLTFALAGTTNNNGRYPLQLYTVKDHGGIDCADSTVDDTGKSYTVYVEFSPSKTEMKICYEAAGGRCYGPVQKLPGM